MRAGSGGCDITPPVGMETPGDYAKAHSADIRDPVKVYAAATDGGEERVALLDVDTRDLQADEVMARVRQAIQDRCALPGDHVLIGAPRAQRRPLRLVRSG
jgi:hypothetical protein